MVGEDELAWLLVVLVLVKVDDVVMGAVDNTFEQSEVNDLSLHEFLFFLC